MTDADAATRRRRIVRAIAAVVATPLCCCVIPLRACIHAPAPLDDGPYLGRACDEPGASEAALDRLVLADGRAIEIYPARAGDLAPRMVLRETSGAVRWSRCVEGEPRTEVREAHVEYGSMTAIPGTIAVVGWVDWTHGRERATWHLDWNGDLREYWYSW